ncbi:DUF1513 domain-containing protein [Caldimonas manganoxidans]|uniref:DUF1513 domain-containing protein n=1 Tax=Caldimonas manganoxidans TaxID=196015 RepID=UPI000364A75B|nr:DUF1513 domain-containing protein [Caldimonas manganoxidans]
MPMAIELTRRRFGLWLGAALGGASAWAWAEPGPRLLASWRLADGRYQVGWLLADRAQGAWRVHTAVDLPTRAHGVWIGPDGSVYAAARRPGDWLLRWAPATSPRWAWLDPGRSLNGHVLPHPEGRVVLTTETDLDSGMGLVAVRDARTLEVMQEWPSHGRDPHQLLWDRQHPDRLYVANGGIETRPETGRRKWGLDRMDASLVCLDWRAGQLLGQWRLRDERLSVRHLAWSGSRLGVALQAEHDEATQREHAPVLALLEPEGLRAVPFDRPLAGYGGDIAGTAEGFAVACPRAGGVALYHPDGRARGWVPLSEACALAVDPQERLWMGGHPEAGLATERLRVPALQLDNHWRV